MTEEIYGDELLDELETWFGRFILPTETEDLALMALWTVHTHLVRECFTTPRLLLDSTMPGSGKTTLLEHFSRLCCAGEQVASLTSPALLPRLLQSGIHTILVDEVHRSLRPDRPNVEDLISIVNTGYRFGATRPVLVPTKGGGWDTCRMSVFAPVVLAGNSPHLPDDTMQRTIRILLMPDLAGVVEDSDWEYVGGEARDLHDRIVDWCEGIRGNVAGMVVALPHGCIGRAKEKWRPLKRIAVAAGGRWPAVCDALIRRGLDEDEAEREAGLRSLPPGIVALTDIREVWPTYEDKTPFDFAATRLLVDYLIRHNPDYWGIASPYGKPLTETRFGRLIAQASKVTSVRPGGRGPRGYLYASLEPTWHRLGIGPNEPGAPGKPGEPGAHSQVHRDHQVHRVNTDPPTQPGDYRRLGCVCTDQPKPCYWCQLAATKAGAR
ncbi:DUF3631 domain-containing protein [Mycobacterium interjectum]|uniref:DUF3631 domain-containing protein n=1 Tax=Mycobacterium interjectum TaxID=33895 RepID=UPI0008308F86|nr:DUF3631 domain-containing protein [Mycobacterium interjectum]MCV7090028.1 DUF3631 domain-containing protein [Mycobacterium interjectum]